MTRTDRSPLIIIGMHRSGTTLFTDLLRRCGVFMGKDLSSNKESYFFTRANDNLLAHYGASWYNPVPVKGDCPVEFERREFFRHFIRYRRYPLNFTGLFTGMKWGWKNPRNTFTAEYWISRYFHKARVIHVCRNGIDAAISLHRRNERLKTPDKVEVLSDPVYCFSLWEAYVRQGLEVEKNVQNGHLRVHYEDLIGKKKECISQIEDFTGISGLEAAVARLAKSSGKNHMENREQYTDLTALASQSQSMKALGYVN